MKKIFRFIFGTFVCQVCARADYSWDWAPLPPSDLSPRWTPFEVGGYGDDTTGDLVDIQLYKNGVLIADASGWSGHASVYCTGIVANGQTEFVLQDNRSNVASAYSNFGIAADNQAPTTPTGLTASNQTSTSVTLTWNACSDNSAISGYQVVRDGNTFYINVSSPTQVITGLQMGVPYQFRVRAIDVYGNYAESAPLAVTLGDIIPPSTPSSLAATNQTSTTFTLSWTASTDNVGVTGYEIKRSATSLGTVTGTSMALSGLQATITNQFYVRARDAAGNWSAWSAALAVTLSDTDPPSAPGGVAAVSVTYSSVPLSWSASSDDGVIAGYDVYRSQSGGPDNLVGTSTTLAFTDSHVLPSTSYTYRIKARDTTGKTSAASAALTVSTSALPDQNGDGVPDPIASLTGLSGTATTSTSLNLKTHKPQ